MSKPDKNRRRTRTVSSPTVRKPEDGRPKGTLKRFPFEQTPLGFMLRYEMPVVYHLLKQLCAAQEPFEPDWRVVESVARLSNDASYCKPKFRRYLEKYRCEGLYCRRGKRLTPERKAYYASIRRRKVAAFIRQNRQRLQTLHFVCRHETIRPEEIRNICKLKI